MIITPHQILAMLELDMGQAITNMKVVKI